jgi:catalase
LAQIFNIAPEYAQGVYDGLKKKEFDFSEVEELSKTAQEWYKEKKFRPSPENHLMGLNPGAPIYGM